MRQRALALTGVALIFGTWSCTKAPDPQTTTAPAVATPVSVEVVVATITQLENDWVAAIKRKDTAVLDRLIADDFVGTSPTAHRYTKAIAIADLKAATYVVDEMDVDEVFVNVYGTTAVSFTNQEEKSKYGRTNTSGHYLFTDVWVERDGRWQVVASHGTRYDDPMTNEKTK